MEAIRDRHIKKQLTQRRSRLSEAITQSPQNEQLKNLLQEVDDALNRIEKGRFGICETCHENIDSDRLLIDPLVRYCIDHLSPAQQRSLEIDLDLASKIQNTLLPKKDFHIPGWMIDYHYAPAGPVSGDYIDVIKMDMKDDSFYFVIGDVSGKGIAASMLMAHLHATFRSLIITGVPLDRIMRHANKLFCEGTMTSYFATLVFGFVAEGKNVEIYNAGHCLPILLKQGELSTIPSTGLPLGLHCEVEYPAVKISMGPQDSLLLYTDGLTEAKNEVREEYGEDRLIKLVNGKTNLKPLELIRDCIDDMVLFRNKMAQEDDITMMVIQRTM